MYSNPANIPARCRLLLHLSAVLLFQLGSVHAEPAPNIVFILADDLGWNAPGCYGNRSAETPNLDRLAREGMRFTRAYADTQCSPTRGSLLSGQYGARNGLFAVTHEKPPARAPLLPPPVRQLGPETAHLAETLRRVGYATGLSGKWHIADNYHAAPLRRRDGGKYFDRYGFDFVGDAANARDRSAKGITDDLLEFITARRSQPFFAYFSHHAPHTPMEAPPELVAKYVAKGFTRSSSNLGLFAERPTADYLAMLEHLDTQIGRVLARLDELDLARRTLVIFYSDNGGLNRMADMSPLREAKGSAYEGGIRVPLIARWPGRIKPGGVCDTPVHAVDFYPTFAALASAKPPVGHHLDGEDLTPLLLGTGRLQRDTLFWHMPTYTAMYGRTPCSVVMRGDWKLVHWFGDYLDTNGHVPEHGRPYGKLIPGSRDELFNLANDPSETTDLSKARPEITAELKEKLADWWRETGAAMPKPNPSFDPETWWMETPSTPSTKSVDADKLRTDGGFVFGYFYGGKRQNEGLHLAISRDGLDWSTVGNGKPLFHPGFGERFRDPSFIRDPDGKRIHMVWTTERPDGFGHAVSTDLIEWKDAREIRVMASVEGVINTWAPELFWDDPNNRWIAMWASSVKGRFPETAHLANANPKANNRMYAATSTDLLHWSEPALLFDFGFPSNDAFLLPTPGVQGGDYTLYVKEIKQPGKAAAIRVAIGPSPLGPFTLTAEKVTGEHQFCEGPVVMKIDGLFYCYFDLSNQHRMAVSRSTAPRGAPWEDLTARLTLPNGAKHGSILQVDEATFQALKQYPLTSARIRPGDLRIRDPFIHPDPERGICYLYRQIANGRGDTTVEPKEVEVLTSGELEIWSGPETVSLQPAGF